MIVRPPAERPAVLALAFADRQVVDAGDSAAHEAVLGELPVFVAVRAEPVAGIVVPLICEANGDARLLPGPDFLDQAVVELLGPLAAQELHDRLAPAEKLAPVAPGAVGRIGERDALGVAAVPGIFGGARLLHRAVARERGKGG